MCGASLRRAGEGTRPYVFSALPRLHSRMCSISFSYSTTDHSVLGQQGVSCSRTVLFASAQKPYRGRLRLPTPQKVLRVPAKLQNALKQRRVDPLIYQLFTILD